MRIKDHAEKGSRLGFNLGQLRAFHRINTNFRAAFLWGSSQVDIVASAVWFKGWPMPGSGMAD